MLQQEHVTVDAAGAQERRVEEKTVGTTRVDMPAGLGEPHETCAMLDGRTDTSHVPIRFKCRVMPIYDSSYLDL